MSKNKFMIVTLLAFACLAARGMMADYNAEDFSLLSLYENITTSHEDAAQTST